MKACIVDRDGARPESVAHTHIHVNTRSQNGANKATKVNIMVVVEEKHFTPNTPFCCAPNQQIATHSRRIPPSDASTAEWSREICPVLQDEATDVLWSSSALCCWSKGKVYEFLSSSFPWRTPCCHTEVLFWKTKKILYMWQCCVFVTQCVCTCMSVQYVYMDMCLHVCMYDMCTYVNVC